MITNEVKLDYMVLIFLEKSHLNHKGNHHDIDITVLEDLL